MCVECGRHDEVHLAQPRHFLISSHCCSVMHGTGRDRGKGPIPSKPLFLCFEVLGSTETLMGSSLDCVDPVRFSVSCNVEPNSSGVSSERGLRVSGIYGNTTSTLHFMKSHFPSQWLPSHILHDKDTGAVVKTYPQSVDRGSGNGTARARCADQTGDPNSMKRALLAWPQACRNHLDLPTQSAVDLSGTAPFDRPRT